MTEQELVERCREGNREAQRELYDRTSERIYRLLLKMTANPHDAFDLAQETYLKAFTRIDRFDGRSAVATWLYRIAVTEALQFLRRRKRFRMKLQDDHSGRVVEAATEQTVARLDMNEALAALEPTDQTILLLRYHEGLDYRAIAQVVECAEGTVASRLHRARERLGSILGASYAPREGSEAAEHQKDRRAGRTGSPAITGKPQSHRKRRE